MLIKCWWWNCPFSIGIRKKRDKKQKRKRINIKYPKLLDDIQNIFNIEELKYLSLQSIRKELLSDLPRQID